MLLNTELEGEEEEREDYRETANQEISYLQHQGEESLIEDREY